MKRIKFILIFILFLGATTISFAQYLSVNDTYTAQQLVQDILVNSPCANVSNFSASGGNFATGEKSYGFFDAGTSGFPLANGVVLSTCRANYVVGPNGSILSDSAPNWLGDSDLSQALNIPNISNATLLEFDFVPLTTKISFDYIFSSEEYHGNAPCSYSDGFAFLLKVAGSTDPYQNLAVIPNTAIPVKVTTVHPNISGSCIAQNENYFGSYNSLVTPTNFNGQTVVMTAKGDVVPGITYHIKLVIADETNPQYDSAIFLGANSFNIGLNIGTDRLLATNNPLCGTETLTLDGTLAGNNSYQWYKDGVAILGEINPTYLVTTAGTYKVEVTPIGTICGASGQIVIEYSPLPILNNTTLVQCDDNNDGISFFNLTKVDAIITGGSNVLSIPVYYKSLYDAQNQINAITNPTNFSNATTNQVYARVTSEYSCTNYATVSLVISNTTVTAQNYSTCDTIGTQDGITTLELNTTITPQLLLGLPSGLIVEYYTTISDAVIQTNSLPTNFTNTTAYQQLIYARIVNGADCYAIVPVTIYVKTFDTTTIEDETLYVCKNSNLTLVANPNYSNYLWSTGAISNTIIVTTAGTYSVLITNSDGCSVTKTFTVLESEIAELIEVIVTDFSDDLNSIQINVTGNGVYEYSLNGINYQSGSYFTNVFPDEYTLFIRDKNGCGTIQTTTVVLNYPKYFTPNDDGINDVWNIKNLSYFPDARVTIFDQYGKLIYSFKQNEKGWDGTLNQTKLLSSDYWFTIQFQNRSNVKGHFALKR
ncbi:choice-of-anchor L domain-containing protein [Flavobacterium sp. SUN052]|uniref:T9SS type B sorting domain-containing protein n=1 Tax=Flavobacterium sp. SUN052 TaxID=3002441 RepID=UPI00237EE56B|nr:choice-of-anchor L domain-containing protein [Flavobacterium sp. SUN052]MEC4003891.1 choice-of-anchor L domain-containing protein [Flavobacterium sp. SUN052]